VKKLLIIIFILQGCAWSNTDKALFGALTLFKTVDILQTREGISNPNFHEINPIMENMTPDQATVFMVGTLGLVYLAADNFPDYRTWIIGGALAISAVCVFNNFSVGIRL
jgi:hypothetical protein